MSLNVGRLELPELTTVGLSGRSLSLSGTLVLADDALFLRAQLLGLEEEALDGGPVPVWWSVDPSLDGFYRITAVSSTLTAEDGQMYGDLMPWSIDLERERGNPAVEAVLIGAVRANDHTIDDTDVAGWHATTDDVYSYNLQGLTGIAGMTPTVRQVDEGAVNVWSPNPASYSALNRFVSWVPIPSSYYVGAGRVFDGNGNVMTGRTGTPAGIDNGMVRVEIADAENDAYTVDGSLRVTAWDGSWVSATDFVLATSGAGWSILPDTARVLANRPERVVIRVDAINSYDQPVAVDLSLRRGSRMVEVTATTVDDSFHVAVTVASVAGEADTALTGGQRRTSDDADGNRWVIATPHTFAAAATGGGVDIDYTVVDNVAQAGIGFELGGSTATGDEAAQALVYEYMAAQDETQRIVAR